MTQLMTIITATTTMMMMIVNDDDDDDEDDDDGHDEATGRVGGVNFYCVILFCFFFL